MRERRKEREKENRCMMNDREIMKCSGSNWAGMFVVDLIRDELISSLSEQQCGNTGMRAITTLH